MTTQDWKSLTTLLIFAAGAVRAEQPTVEELPPPAAKSVLAKEPPSAAPAEAADSIATTPGWGVYGPLGRVYSVGDLAVVDYLREGRRHIVALTEEDPASHASIDSYYLYFREVESGHRWAIGRQMRTDGTYSLYFQAADEPGDWNLFQRSRLIEGTTSVDLSVPMEIVEPGCGH